MFQQILQGSGVELWDELNRNMAVHTRKRTAGSPEEGPPEKMERHHPKLPNFCVPAISFLDGSMIPVWLAAEDVVPDPGLAKLVAQLPRRPWIFTASTAEPLS